MRFGVEEPFHIFDKKCRVWLLYQLVEPIQLKSLSGSFKAAVKTGAFKD
jgi:hypothetical protein